MTANVMENVKKTPFTERIRLVQAKNIHLNLNKIFPLEYLCIFSCFLHAQKQNKSTQLNRSAILCAMK